MKDREQDLTAFSVKELLSYDNEHFVHQAYHYVLGREPDENGRANALCQLAKGYNKIIFLNKLQHSPEAQQRGDYKVFGRALRHYKRTKWPLLGIFFSLFYQYQHQASLRKIKQLVRPENLSEHAYKIYLQLQRKK